MPRHSRPSLAEVITRTPVKGNGALPLAPTMTPVSYANVFPEDGYVGLAADFAALYAEHTEVPRTFLYFSWLTYLGSVLAPHVTLRSALRPSPRCYTACVAQSGFGRKSTALDVTDDFFQRVRPELDGHVQYGLGSAEGLATRLERDPQTHAIRPLLLHLDELRLLPDKAKQDGSILVPMITSLFEKTKFDNQTMTRKISVRDGHLSLVAACTAETYATIWTPAFIHIGFPSRLWLVTGSSDQRIALPPPVPDRLLDALVGDADRLLTDIMARAPIALSLAPDADVAWKTWYGTMSRDLYARRLDTYGWKFMILLSLNRGDLDVVSLDTVRRVTALLDHQYALRVEYDPVDAENAMARMEQRIRKVLKAKGSITERDLRRALHAYQDGYWTFKTALSNLFDAGDIRLDRTTIHRTKHYVLTTEASLDA